MQKIKFMVGILVISALLMPVSPVHADSAPPVNPPGGDISPEGGTEVQMVAEQVIFDFRQSTDDSANVSAWFLLHNTGDVDEHLKVRFPLNGDPHSGLDPATGEMKFDYPLIRDFSATIGGQKLQTQTMEDSDPNAEQFFLGYGSIIYWSVFEVDFPAGKDVKLTVNYTYRPTEEAYDAQIYYILATGAGWKGPIKTADVIIRLPYILNDINGLPRDSLTWGYGSSLKSIEENQIRLHWDDLEPTNQDNIELNILQPHLWQEILRRRVQVIGSPDDAASWEALTKAYAAAAVERHGFFYNPPIVDLYIQACERALTLDPHNASLHLQFAYNLYNSPNYQEDYYKAVVRNELAIVLQLDPTNPDAATLLQSLDVAEQKLMTTPGPFPTKFVPTPTEYGYIVPAETATPEPPSTATPTMTIVPTTTATPMPTPTATPLPPEVPSRNENSPWLFVLVGIIFAAAGFSGGWVLRARKKS